MLATPHGLDRTLVALADATRRAILQRLSRGEARVTELAEPFAISLNSGVERRFNQAPERVFDAFLDPAKARHFLFAARTSMLVKAEVDARDGWLHCQEALDAQLDALTKYLGG